MKKHPEITLKGEGAGMVCASWQTDKARFHVWIHGRREGWQIAETIYKNPPCMPDGRGMPSTHPDYFDTRYLDLTAKAHSATRAIIEELATPERCDELAAEHIRETEEKHKREAFESNVRHLAECVAAIRGANADALAAAMLHESPSVAAAAERLRTVEAGPSAIESALIDAAALLRVYAHGRHNNETRGQAMATIREIETLRRV